MGKIGIEMFEDMARPNVGPNTSVTVVMNVFKRPENFEAQLAAIRRQTHEVNQIMVWVNGAATLENRLTRGLLIGRCSENLGVWARFAFALNAKSDFIWLIDDDTIPGDMWLENALRTFAHSPGVIGSRGLRFAGRESYLLYSESGPAAANVDIEEVDIVGHNWIVPRSWLGVFWAEYFHALPSDTSGEDIHLSFAIKKHLGLGTFVPPHPIEQKMLWGELPRAAKLDGTDDAAISRSPHALKKFENAFKHYIRLGFSPISLLQSRSIQVKTQTWLIGNVASRFPRTLQGLAELLGIKKRK